jgi:enamine deaminase RidA (YjgF/YER057c/UK114 family)
MTTQRQARIALNVEGLARPRGVWSTVTVARPSRLVFVSGLLAQDADGAVVGVGDITAQTEQVLTNLKIALAAVGAGLRDIVRLDVYVRDIAQFKEIHAVRAKYFPTEPPASTMVEVSRFIDPDCLIEINAIASLAD